MLVIPVLPVIVLAIMLVMMLVIMLVIMLVMMLVIILVIPVILLVRRALILCLGGEFRIKRLVILVPQKDGGTIIKGEGRRGGRGTDPLLTGRLLRRYGGERV